MAIIKLLFLILDNYCLNNNHKKNITSYINYNLPLSVFKVVKFKKDLKKKLLLIIFNEINFCTHRRNRFCLEISFMRLRLIIFPGGGKHVAEKLQVVGQFCDEQQLLHSIFDHQK